MEVDFSAQIKARNLSLASKPLEFDGFKLSEKAQKFLQSKASAQNEKFEVLTSVIQNGFEAAKNFFRPSVSDLEFSIARLNKYINSSNSALLTSSLVDLCDLEIGLARVTIVENKLSEADFKEVKAEMDDMKCECEDETEEEEMDGKTVCAKCKKAKAKKNC